MYIAGRSGATVSMLAAGGKLPKTTRIPLQ